jgi:hypothetical protein
MSASKPQRESKTILTDDGELQDVHGTPEPREAPVFCIHCGTANRTEARYCRNCGRSLEDQEIDADLPEVQAVPGARSKNKRLTAQKGEHSGRPFSIPAMTPFGLVLELATLIVVSGLIYFVVTSGVAWLAVVILIAWFMIVAARNGALNEGDKAK